MNIAREQRDELKALSKEIFGTTSAWSKILERGVPTKVTEEVEEVVPGEKLEDGTTTPDTIRKVTVNKKNEHGIEVSTVKYHTVDSLLELLRELKADRDKRIAEIIKKQQEDAAIKQAQDQAGGSAV